MEEKILKLYAALPSDIRQYKSIWIIGEQIFPEIQKLEMEIGSGGGPIYCPPQNDDDRFVPKPGKLLGRPIEIIEGDCLFFGLDSRWIDSDIKHTK